MEFQTLILSRRSGRKYTGNIVPADCIQQIMNAGLLAPSSRNLKSSELIAVNDPQMLNQLSHAKAAGGGMLKDAACGIVVIGDSERSDAWIEDCSITMTYMMLKATELGIANCWVQIRNRFSAPDSDGNAELASEKVRKLLQIPENFSVLAILSLGCPAENLIQHSFEEIDPSKIHIETFK